MINRIRYKLGVWLRKLANRMTGLGAMPAPPMPSKKLHKPRSRADFLALERRLSELEDQLHPNLRDTYQKMGMRVQEAIAEREEALTLKRRYQRELWRANQAIIKRNKTIWGLRKRIEMLETVLASRSASYKEEREAS